MHVKYCIFFKQNAIFFVLYFVIQNKDVNTYLILV